MSTARGPALTPLLFLDAAARSHPGQIAVVYGTRRYTYRDLWARCLRLAAALTDSGVRPGDRVAILSPNTPALLEAHYGVPAAGASVVTLNTRLHPGEIAHLLDHSSPRLLFVDEEHADGETLGELIACGNAVAAGYFHNPAATREAFAGSWFRTGDLAVRHPDGSIEVRDRKKDVIISGGENISSIEVEQTLKQHPAVLEAAVVAVPDPRWGERPVAHIELRPGVQVAAAELTAFCRARLAAFKCPDHIQFRALPRTATGKVQKYQLREHG